MTDQEKLENHIECIRIYADSLQRYTNDVLTAYKEYKDDPEQLCKRLDLYMDGIRYNTKKLNNCYKKTCDAVGYFPEYEG